MRKVKRYPKKRKIIEYESPLPVRLSVKLVKRNFKNAPMPIANSLDVWNASKSIHDRDREVILLLHLDAQSNLSGIEECAIGGLTRCVTTVREMFKGAILNNSAALILCHNHPSGDLEASIEDVTLTSALLRAAYIIGIPLLDHVIVTQEDHTSMDLDLLEELTKYKDLDLNKIAETYLKTMDSKHKKQGRKKKK